MNLNERRKVVFVLLVSGVSVVPCGSPAVSVSLFCGWMSFTESDDEAVNFPPDNRLNIFHFSESPSQ